MQRYTYLHRKFDTGDIFYVGKGTRSDLKSIHAAVSGAKKTAYGYQWRYA